MAAIPDGFATVTPHMMIDGADAAIALYAKALGAELVGRIGLPNDDKTVMHAMLRIGSSMIFMSDPLPFSQRKPPANGLSPVGFYLYVEDVDGAHARAVDGGMKSSSEPEDMFWGDRTAVVDDGYGYQWTIASKVRDVTPEEMAEAMKSMARSSQ